MDYLIKLYEEPRRRLLASKSEDNIFSQNQQVYEVNKKQEARLLNYAASQAHRAVSDWMLNQQYRPDSGQRIGGNNIDDGERIYSIPDLTAASREKLPSQPLNKIHYYSATPDHAQPEVQPQPLTRSRSRPPPLPTSQPPPISSRKTSAGSTGPAVSMGVSVPTSPTSPTSQLSFTIKMRPAKENKTSNLQSNLTDLAKLTRRSRELAHSSEDILALQEQNKSSTSNSNTLTTTEGGDGSGTLNLGAFRRTKDFGDFQILTDSPEKTKATAPPGSKKVPPPVPPKPSKGSYRIKSVDV